MQRLLATLFTLLALCTASAASAQRRAGVSGAPEAGLPTVAANHAPDGNGPACGTGVATVAAAGGSCLGFTPAVAGGPDNWEVAEGGSYVMTIAGVTECSGDTITVFVQNSASGNFCFKAARTAAGVYVGAFHVPNPACATMPVSYKCGVASCDNNGAFRAEGPQSGCNGVHLRASFFDANCVKTGTDDQCGGAPPPPPPPPPPPCTPPSLQCPGDKELECGALSDPTSIGYATVSGPCEPVLTYLDVVGGGCTNQDITRTWTATNSAGTVSCVQHIHFVDRTAPVFDNCPADVDLGCNPAEIPQCDAGVTASDACTAANVTCSFVDAADGAHHTRTITYVATDLCGNKATCVQHLRWVEDHGKPALPPLPAGGDLGCNPAPPQCAGGLRATDDVDGSVNVECSPGPVTGNGCRKTQVFTYSATDACGNTSSQDVTYTWIEDTTPPVLPCPADITVDANGGCSATASWLEVHATDDCDGPVTLTYSHESGSSFPVGVTPVTITAKDGCGNTSTCSFNVTVLARLCVHKFFDANLNGVQDPGEASLPGWTIQVAGGPSGVTDANGDVCFAVGNGTWTVSEVMQAGWTNTLPLSQTVTIDAQHCSAHVNFANVCSRPPQNGLTLGFWSNKNGMARLQADDPAWRAMLNDLNLRNADGSAYQVSMSASFEDAFASFRTWILSANATNMAYMLSAQLAATELDVAYNNLNAGWGVVVPGGAQSSGGQCIVPFLSATQPIACADSPLVSLTVMQSASGCGCGSNDGVVTVNALLAAAQCLLGHYGSTVAAGTERTYEECVKSLLDMINNNGNNGYPCGGITRFVNPDPSQCGASDSPTAPSGAGVGGTTFGG